MNKYFVAYNFYGCDKGTGNGIIKTDLTIDGEENLRIVENKLLENINSNNYVVDKVVIINFIKL